MPTESQFPSMPYASAPSATAQSTLQCSLEIQVGKTLKVHARLANTGSAGIYVFNRLWDMDPSGRPVEDPQKMYRYIRNSELRLLWGPAALPRLTTVTYKNIPYATLLEPHGVVEAEQSLAIPVTEYSPYFSSEPEAAPQLMHINQALLHVVWVPAVLATKTSPAPFDPKAIKIEVPGVLDHAQAVTCYARSTVFEGLRRTDQFDRLTLPGEPSEPLQLSH